MYLSSVNIGQYIPTGSVIHRLDPRAKLFSLLAIISAVFPSKTFPGVAVWFLVLILIVKLSKISWQSVIKSAKAVLF
ncbi:MAG: energy-coupling factor transporter transmembrane protein EcfT, partial [Synergistaceae bacterium]|nr:energy-coupling factor transporter transmembrane protein EcfT [Synergistaceae bacterium]